LRNTMTQEEMDDFYELLEKSSMENCNKTVDELWRVTLTLDALTENQFKFLVNMVI
jgi:hypothetical protein